MLLPIDKFAEQRCSVMAIVNLTPDSFYATSRNFVPDAVCRRIDEALAEGATILDLGGYSSRPGADEVSLDEEWRRVSMGLRAVERSEHSVAVSIDTFRAEIIRRAVEEYGAVIVNDISAGELDEQMLSAVAHYDLPYVAMHMRGVPATMQNFTDYPEGVVAAVRDYFERRICDMLSAGIAPKNIILDPGFGFSKSAEQNMGLLAGLHSIVELGYKVLVGVSRKSMIYRPLGISADEALAGSLAFGWEALCGGASILRVHDVKPTRQIVDLYEIYKEYR